MPKILTRLTDRAIKESKPKDKPYFLFDDEKLRLLIRPTGTKVWQYPYIFNAKNNTYTIGKYGNNDNYISLAKARTIRDDIKEMLKAGIDPNQQKKKTKIRNSLPEIKDTFRGIAEEWYKKQSWTEKHAKNIKSRLEKDVFDMIGDTPIRKITAADIVQILRNIEERGAITVAQRINGYCVEIFEYAISLALCDDNPALGRTRILKSHTIQNRKHITERELPEFLRNLYSNDENEKYNINNLSLKLLLLTLQRPGEIRKARWSEFNFKKKLWHIPQERMKMRRDHLVPLSNQAIEVLKTLKTISGRFELLFPSASSTTRPLSDVAMIKKMKKLTSDNMTPHGVRHLGSTILNENSFNGDWIERQLSHVEENKIRGTYNKAEYLEQRKEMMQWWADYLDKRR